MSAVLDMQLPSFTKAHHEWHPKARENGDRIVIKCGSTALTVPKTGKKATDESAAKEAVNGYAKQHGWIPLA